MCVSLHTRGQLPLLTRHRTPLLTQTEHLRAAHWRKSGQFFGLTRAHAEAVLRDVEVYRS